MLSTKRWMIWDADERVLIAILSREDLARIVLTELLGDDLRADDVLNSVDEDSPALQYGGFTTVVETGAMV